MTIERTPDAPNYGVVIPTRGRSSKLLQALESVYSQTFPPAEVVVVIDEDIDGTENAIRKLFPDTRIIVHDKRMGPARSRSDGLSAITSDWVCLLDDDDLWHSKKQEMFAIYLQDNPTCRALRSGFWMFTAPGYPGSFTSFRPDFESEDGRPALERATESATPVNRFEYLDIEGRSVEALLRLNAGVSSTAMFRTELLSEIAEVPDLRTGQDWILWLRIATHTEWHLVPGRWGFIRVHGEQITTDNSFRGWEHRMAAWDYAWREVGWPQGYDRRRYGDEYAWEIHQWFWDAFKAGRYKEAFSIVRAGMEFVDSPLLKMSIILPRPIRWRVRGLLSQSALR